jgi:hypothetical protein
LAAREMLNPKSVAHLLFRNTVAESFEAVAAGQATYAVVPFYNSITQSDGATLKALASGQFEVFAQVCMPTSYVLVAHTDYIDEFLRTYTSIKELGEDPSPEDKAKIYTRFLTRIYVGAHADEQYRGRLIRPDLKNSTVELSRNPLRVLEELSRSDQMTQMMKVSRDTRPDKGGIYLGGGTQQVLVRDTVQAPAALVAAGLLDAPGDPEGWDQPGSLGEIVALLRKLLVLLNVYSFGAPDLPENTTQYLLIGRRGEAAPAKDALKLPATVTTRIMTMIRPLAKKSSADQWLKPYNDISRIAKQFGFVFDRAPVTVSSAKASSFLYEGGKLKDGVMTSPGGFLAWLFGDAGPAFSPAKDRTLRKQIEKKPSDKASDSRFFLGEYPSWCYGVNLKPGETARCCDEPHENVAAPGEDINAPFFQWVIATLVTLTALGLIAMLLYCPLTGACGTGFRPSDMRIVPPPTSPADGQVPSGPRDNADLPPSQPAVVPPKPATQPAEPTASTYPGVNQAPAKPAPAQPSQNGAYPGVNQPPKQAPSSSAPLTPARPPASTAQPARVRPIFHVAFFNGKANLTSETMNVLAAAASQVIQLERPAKIRVASLGPKESDDIWNRRRLALEDELVRQGVPRNQITSARAGSQLIMTIRPLKQPAAPASGKRAALQLDAIGDPLVGEY